MSIFHGRSEHKTNEFSRCACNIIGFSKFLGGLLSLAALNAFAQTANVVLAWNANTNSAVAGYKVYSGNVSGVYTANTNVGSNLTAAVTGLTPGLTYYFAVTDYNSNGAESVFSNLVTNRPSILPSITAQPLSQTAVAGTPVALNVSATGDPPLSYQWMDGPAPIPGATASLLSWSSVGNANAGNYTVVVSNPWGSATSSVAGLVVLDPPSILTQPQSQTVVAGSAASFLPAVAGTAPLSIQWFLGATPLTGATNSVLGWASVAASNAGNYHFTVANAVGVITSSVAILTVTVLTPPSITKQPQSQTVVATTGASFSSTVAGTAPLSIQWFSGATPLVGATNSVLSWASVAASNAGNYHFTVANAALVVTSSVATLTVLPSNTFATVAGVYNGLFFQTNANETSAGIEATAGFLGNCVVAANGAFSAKIYVGGLSYSTSGNFNTSGNHSAMIAQSAGGMSSLEAVLQLDLTNGTQQMTGTISNTTAGNTWSAPLVADLATNAWPKLAGATLVLAATIPGNAPTNKGAASGVVVNGVLTLSGVLGDMAAFSQTVPISKNGFVPIYVSLYNNSGLLEGWIQLSSGGVTGNLTWIRPSGVLLPVGFPQGFDTVLNVTGTTLTN